MSNPPLTKTLILVGMMGAGKSAIGRSLAELTGREYQDTDSLVQSRLGRSITQIFRIYGEDAFREHEAAVLRSLEPEPIVLATGGGIVLREDNWQEMRRLGPILYLRAPLPVLLERLENSRKKRPLLSSESWQETVSELLNHREPLYLKADAVLEVGNEGVDAIAKAAYEIFLRLENQRDN